MKHNTWIVPSQTTNQIEGLIAGLLTAPVLRWIIEDPRLTPLARGLLLVGLGTGAAAIAANTNEAAYEAGLRIGQQLGL